MPMPEMEEQMRSDLDEVDPGGADATYEGPQNKYAPSVVRRIDQRVMSVAHPQS